MGLSDAPELTEHGHVGIRWILAQATGSGVPYFYVTYPILFCGQDMHRIIIKTCPIT